MNQMGMNQAGVGDVQATLSQAQANMGAGYASGAGDIMQMLGDATGGSYNNAAGAGVNTNINTPDLKFEYDQGTYDRCLATFWALLRVRLTHTQTRPRPAICFQMAPAFRWVRHC